MDEEMPFTLADLEKEIKDYRKKFGDDSEIKKAITLQGEHK